MALKLHIAEQDRRLSSATVLVRWTVSKSTLRALERAGLSKKAFVVLVTVPEGGADRYINLELRKVVRLEDQMAHVRFARPGRNRIFAFVAAESRDISSRRYDPRQFYLEFRGISWEHWVVVPEGDTFAEPILYHNQHRELHQPCGTLDVNVPAECFAKPPPLWMQGLVGRPSDQCDFRRQFIISAFVSIFWFPILYLFKMTRYVLALTAVLVSSAFVIILMGDYPSKGTRWRDFFTREFFEDPWKQSSQWGSKVKKWECIWMSPRVNKNFHLVTKWFRPIIPFVIFAFLSLLGWASSKPIPWDTKLFAAFYLCGIFAAANVCLALFIATVKVFFKACWEFYEKRSDTSKQKAKLAAPAAIRPPVASEARNPHEPSYDSNLAALVAPKDGAPVDIRAVANRSVAIRLRMSEIIGKVCRPFAH